MRKLGGLDAMFLYGETAAAPMHVGGLMSLELPENQSIQGFYQGFRQMMAQRLHLVDYLTHKLQVVPYDLDHPVWVKDGDFDLDNHLRLVALPDGQSLESFAAELYEPLMDRSRPLWQMWVIDLGEPGRAALLQKTHHAAIDGMSSLKAAQLLFDFAPEPRKVDPAPVDFWQPVSRSTLDVWMHSLENLSRYWWDSVTRLPTLVQTMAQLWQREFGNGAIQRTAPTPASAPRTRLNRAIDARRAFRNVQMSLPEVKALSRQCGVKVNDVMLAICGEGVRRYLASHGDTLNEPLLASCPVSLHRPEDSEIRNRVSSINVSMANHVEDLRERLMIIHESANGAKQGLDDLRDLIPEDFGAPGLPALIQQLAQSTQDGGVVEVLPRMPMNLVLSNVPGFKDAMYVAGARLETQMPMSIVTHGAAVNLTVTSYTDRLDLGVTAATRCIPDVDALTGYLQAAYRDYLGLGSSTDSAPDAEVPLAVADQRAA